MLSTNTRMTLELQKVYDEIVRPLDNNNLCTVVTLMSNGQRYYQEYEDLSTGMAGYTDELSWALENDTYVTEVVCFVLESPKAAAPKYLFHATGFEGSDLDLPDIEGISDEADEEEADEG